MNEKDYFWCDQTKADFKLLQGGEGMEMILQIKSVKFTDTEKVNIQTNQGFMSAWNKELGEELQRRVGQNVNCEVKEAGKYKNIRGIVGWVEGQTAPITESEKIVNTEKPVIIDDNIVDGARVGVILKVAGSMVAGSGSGDFADRCLRCAEQAILMEKKIREGL